ncbi:MAG: serpin family protein [Bacteroidaceae bacterium]|nr:serpin family protein [Bacteroidaceae bacterium]
MKHTFRNLLLSALALGLTVSSCSSDEDSATNSQIWDIAPVVVSVKVLSPEGYSVLNGYNTRSISATYRGNTYYCQRATTRYYAPTFYGLAYANDYLLFGELDAEQTYMGEPIIINWGDDSKADTITFSHRLEWQDNTPHFQQKFWLNGHEVTGQITIHKDLQRAPEYTPRQDMPVTAEQKRMLTPINDFGFDLFRQLKAAADEPHSSLVASPLSVAYVLGMLATAASADEGPEGTRGEILKALHMEQQGVDAMNALFKILADNASLVDTQTDIQLACALFVRQGYPIYGGYPSFLADYYHADYEQLDFASPTALERINAWCNQKTKGLIPSILDEIPPLAMAYLLNAIYFRGGWSTPFYPDMTREADFTRTDGTVSKLPLMHENIATFYAHTDAFDAMRLPFGQGSYQMTFLLPTGTNTTDQLVQQLSSAVLEGLTWQYADVNITLPRFSVVSDYKELPQQLEALGVHRAFIPRQALFTNMTPDEDLYVSNMRQKARLAVDEKGCEAAAVTIAGMETTAMPDEHEQVTFCANRPFVYLITEVSSGTVFFIGTYEGEPASAQ